MTASERKKFAAEMGRDGGLATARNSTPEQRVARAKHANKARLRKRLAAQQTQQAANSQQQ